MIDMETRMVVLSLEFPIPIWKAIDDVEKEIGTSTSKVLSTILSTILKQSIMKIFLDKIVEELHRREL